MKIRLGFVPNSSSSSFIVIFPRIPKTVKEVFNFLFGKTQNPEDFVDNDNILTYYEAARIVFKDLKNKSSKATQKKLLDLFSYRYHFINQSGCRFYQKGYLCWGTDIVLVNKIKEITISSENNFKTYSKKLYNLTLKYIKQVPYAWEGSKDDKGNPLYTPEQVVASAEYCKKVKEFKETNKEYIRLEKESRESRNNDLKLKRKLEKQLAKKDFTQFKKEAKGKFVATFVYSDNDSDIEGKMEHSGIFRGLPNIAISNH